MSRIAWTYVITVILVGGLVAERTLSITPLENGGWGQFAVFLALAIIAQLFKVPGPTHDAYHINLVFLFAGVFSLSPFQYVLLVMIPHLIEWAKERILRTRSLRSWYIQPVNISVHIIAGLSARWLNDALLMPGSAFAGLSTVVAACCGAVAYVMLNHLLIGEAIVLARKVSWRESGIFNVTNLVTNLVLLLLGYTVAVMWATNPWLILTALSPLVLMYRALNMAKLTREAQTDEKTGLFNARHFMTLYSAELEKAQRLSHPLTLLMTDLDLLRNINNTYGHLAGDAVLAGVAAIIRDGTRNTDVAGRFGGEEFCIVLPDTGSQEAVVIAERLRERVAETEYMCQTLAHPVHATISIGVACFPSDAKLPFDLIHHADIAVYQAKLDGRNRVVTAASIPHMQEQGCVPGADRATPAAGATFVPRPVPQWVPPTAMRGPVHNGRIHMP